MSIASSDPVRNHDSLAQTVTQLQAFVQQAAQQGTPVHEVERGLWQQLLRLGQQLLTDFFTQVGTGDLGPTLTLPNGETVRRLEQPHARRYVSIFGNFQLSRTVYGSREGQALPFVPLDNRLHLPASIFSYVLQDWDQALGVEQAFGQVNATIARMLDLKQSVDSLETMNRQMAKGVTDYREQRPVPAAETEGELFVASADGKGVVIRGAGTPALCGGHREKGQKANQKRMAIVGTVYSVDRYERTAEDVVAALFRDPEAVPPPRPQPQNKRVWASLPLTGAEPLAAVDLVYPWLHEELYQRNPGGQRPTVYLHDGQESLWDARRRHLPDEQAVDVLDLLHVTPRLWEAAHVFHKEGSGEVVPFVRERVKLVLEGKVESVIRGLRRLGAHRQISGTKKKTLRRLCRYLWNNRERMQYDVYLQAGYPIASGVIEGACRHLVKDRLERAGMHWTPEGAQAMLDLRSTYLNGDWQDYQTYRIASEKKRLYPYQELVAGEAFFALAC
jgi:hypothetical protein